MERPVFRSVHAYGRRFTDAAFWRPYVEEVCRRHDLQPCEGIRAGLPGTHPVFLVSGQWVVKFFAEPFRGADSYAVEREVCSLLQQVPDFPGPHLLAEGDLFPHGGGWHWPYLVFTELPGRSLCEISGRLSAENWEAVACYLGHWLQELHGVRLDESRVLRPDWPPFAEWLVRQQAACVDNHRRWGSLPEHLIAQIEDYLPSVDALLDRSVPPLLLHCDMNADHLLGEFQEVGWVPSGIIDFGDAGAGDFFYELGALHLGLFGGDTRLLRLFLQEYGRDMASWPDFTTRAMSMTLLHEFDVLEGLKGRFPLGEVITLDDLADRLWNVDVASLQAT